MDEHRNLDPLNQLQMGRRVPIRGEGWWRTGLHEPRSRVRAAVSRGKEEPLGVLVGLVFGRKMVALVETWLFWSKIVVLVETWLFWSKHGCFGRNMVVFVGT